MNKLSVAIKKKEKTTPLLTYFKCYHHIQTSKLIWIGNRLSCFYMMVIWVFNRHCTQNEIFH